MKGTGWNAKDPEVPEVEAFTAESEDAEGGEPAVDDRPPPPAPEPEPEEVSVKNSTILHSSDRSDRS